MNRSVAAPLADFPAQIHLPEVCVGGCTSDLRLPDEPDGTPGGFKEDVLKLWHHLQLACRFAPTTKNNPTIGLRFDDCNGRAPSDVIMVGHHSHNFDSRFEATCFRMVPIVEALASGQIELPSPPFLLKLDVQDTANGLWPCIYSETGVLRRLLALSPCWDISYVISRRVSFARMTRLVTEFKPLQYQNALLLEEEAKERAAALRTLRKTMRAPGPAGGSAGSTRAQSRGRGRGCAAREKKRFERTPSWSSAESDQSEDAETEQYWNSIMQSLTKAKGKAKTTSSAAAASSSGHPAVDEPSPEPGELAAGSASRAVPRPAARRTPQSRGYLPAVGGGECFFEAYTGGSTGKPYANWILKCPKHQNCQKTRGVGSFSTKRYGELEPLAHLHAWRDMDVPAHNTHRLCNPLAAEVDRQMDSNMAAFADLNARFHLSAGLG